MTRWLLLFVGLSTGMHGAGDEFLRWDAKRAKGIALAARLTGQVGKSLDFRVLATDRSYNFKLRATWLHPAAVKALARMHQLSRALTDEETRRLVGDGLALGPLVMQIEIDPREGSGIIPNEWVALLGPHRTQASEQRVIRGTRHPELRELPALAVVPPRDYSYEVFWVVFPATGEDGAPLFADTDNEAELSIQIQGKVGKVRWPLAGFLR